MLRNFGWLRRKDRSLNTAVRCFFLFRGLLYFMCIVGNPSSIHGRKKAKEPHLVVRENEACGENFKWLIGISQPGTLRRHCRPWPTLPLQHTWNVSNGTQARSCCIHCLSEASMPCVTQAGDMGPLSALLFHPLAAGQSQSPVNVT